MPTRGPATDRSAPAPAHGLARGAAVDVARVFLRLGLTAFGGPVAHIAHFRLVFVERLHWLDDARFAQLLAVCQFLPGPASSQLGFGIGLLRAGWAGALAAFVAFTVPSALLMLAFALSGPLLPAPWSGAVVHGLKLVAVAVVAQALVSMARQLAPDIVRRGIALGAFALLWLLPMAWLQWLVMLAGGALGLLWCRPAAAAPADGWRLPYGRGTAWACAGLFALLLAAALAVAVETRPTPWALAAVFYRAGALVFGGGHVVLPLLETAVVREGWLAADGFMAVYGLAQAVPGPMFSLAAGLGAQVQAGAPALAMGMLALLAVFLPGFLLLLAALPAWGWLVARPHALGAVAGLNAVVVGLLAAALAGPLWTQGVRDGLDLAVVAVGFALLQWARIPPLAVVLGCVAATLLRAAVAG